MYCPLGAFFNHRIEAAALIVLCLGARATRAAAFPDSIFGAEQERVLQLGPRSQCGFPMSSCAYLPLPINEAALRIQKIHLFA